MHSKSFDYVVAGSSVASLVAIRELRRRGSSVCWLRSSVPLGGVFWGCDFKATNFDRGMMLVEPTAFASEQSSDLKSYRQDVRNDIARFTSLINKYLTSLDIDFRRVATPKIRAFNQTFDDFIISNRLGSLAHLPKDLRDKLRQELSDICRLMKKDPNLHASNKLTKNYQHISYEEASKSNHGETFHREFINLFALKLGVGSLTEIQAKHHRGIWLPLFYPETLMMGLDGDVGPLESTHFTYPSQGSFRCIVEKFLFDVRVHQEDLSRLTLINLYAGEVEFLIGSESIKATRVIWGDRLSRLQSLLSLSENKPIADDTATFNIFYLKIPLANLTQDFSTMFVLEEKSIIFRISNQSFCAGDNEDSSRICVEVKKGFFSSSDILEELVNLQVITRYDGNEVLGSETAQLPLPSFHNLSSSKICRDRVREHFQFSFVGHAAEFGSGSFNDQIVQGLSAAD